MDPISLTAISIGASVAGAGVGALGSIMGGNAQKDMYEYKSAVAKINAQISEQNAQYETAAGETEAQRSGIKSRFQAGTAKVAQAAGNLDVNAGSNVKVQESMRDVANLDESLIRSNAARKAYGYRVQGLNQTAEGRLASAAGTNAQTAGYIGAASSILGGASSVSDKWMQASRLGIV